MALYISVLTVATIIAATIAAYWHSFKKIQSGRELLPEADMLPVQWGLLRGSGVFFLFVLFHLGASLIYITVWGRPDTSAAFAGTAIMAYGLNLITLTAIYLNANSGGDAMKALGLKSLPVVKALGIGAYAYLLFIPFQLIYGIVVHTAWSLLTDRPFPVQEVSDIIIRAEGLSFAVLVVVATVLAPFFEEVVFRAFLQAGMEKSLGPSAGIFLTAILFTVVHGAHAMLQVFPVAMALGLLYWRTRSLAACIAFHCCVNITALLLLPLLPLA